ncbi:MAG: Ig domain-containing protein, partial [Lachnospiraceae bacterium]
MKKRIFLLSVFLLVFFIGSTTVYADSFSINKTKATMNIGDTIDLDISGTDKVPHFASYNVNIAKVDQNGIVTAVRKGTTTISVRVGLTYKKCTVTVVDSGIKLNKTSATIYTGGTSTKTVQLRATVKGASKAVQWESLNPMVATVDETGKVTSVSEGTAVITATANGKRAACPVTVKESSILLNMDSMQLSTKGNGSSMKLTPSVTGSSKSVKWTTSDKTIATVSGGRVTGKNTGTAIITATANGVSATCEVNVIKGSVSISEEKVLLYTGETKQLKTNAGSKDVVTWNSSDDTVITVDEKGKITAAGAGTAVISATLNGTTDTCEITVKDIVTEIEEETVSLKTKGTDKTYTLHYNVIGRSSSIRWTTSDNKVATVSKGKITAKKAGTTTITATANGISDTVEVTVSVYDPTISLSQPEYTLYTKKGNTYTLKAAIDGPVKKAVWESSNPEVATVVNGKVTAVGEGQTVITASANGVTAECLITVKESKVILGTENITLDKGETAQLPADVVGYSQTLAYTTTNSKVATVKNGIITAKSYGEADIKVTANGVSAVCHVKVGVCEHIYNEGVVTKEATCTEPGVKTFTCTLCGDAYTEDIPLKDHEYANTSVTAPTCTEKGYTTHTCTCGDSYVDTYVDALGHAWGEWITTKEPTETETGEKKHICSRCKAEETESIPVKEHEHIYTETVTAPTCTEKGYTTHTCTCG